MFQTNSMIRSLAKNLFIKAHCKIFVCAPSSEMMRFIVSLFWSFLGFAVSGLVFFAVNIVVGRALGPDEYGYYALIATIASFIAVFMFAGFDSTSIKFVSCSTSYNERRNAVSVSYIFVIASILGVALISLIFIKQIALLLNTHTIVILFGIILGIITVLKVLTENIVKSIHEFKLQSSVKIIESLMVFLLVILIILIARRDYYSSYFYIVATTSLVVISIYMLKVRQYIYKWDKSTWNTMKPYWKGTLKISIITIIMSSIDKFFISRYLGSAQLGLYSAYLLSSTVIVGQITGSLLNVLFPSVNVVKEKKEVIKKINRIALIGFLPIMVVVSLMSILTIRLFGSQYELNYWYILIVSLVAYFQVVATFYGSIVSASANLFKMASRYIFLKPLIVGLLVVLLILTTPNSLYVFFLIPLMAYLYDVLSSHIFFRVIKDY